MTCLKCRDSGWVVDVAHYEPHQKSIVPCPQGCKAPDEGDSPKWAELRARFIDSEKEKLRELAIANGGAWAESEERVDALEADKAALEALVVEVRGQRGPGGWMRPGHLDEDSRVQKLLSFKSISREDLAVLVVTGTDRANDVEAELKRFRDNCPHVDTTLNGDGSMTCDLCGKTEDDSFSYKATR